MAWLRRPYEYLVYYGFLLLFAMMCLVWSLASVPLTVLLPRQTGRRLGRRVISAGFRTYLQVLEWSGIVECELDELDGLSGHSPLIIASNHPSLVDVVLVASRLPNVACIIKASLWDQLLFGGSVRLAGYIRNTSQPSLIRDATQELRTGTNLLVFPEGTRTVGDKLQRFKGGFALIAKKARVPVQTVLIEINHPFLGKGRPILEKPQFPLVFRATLGRRFMPPDKIRPYISELETYYRGEMAQHGTEVIT